VNSNVRRPHKLPGPVVTTEEQEAEAMSMRAMLLILMVLQAGCASLPDDYSALSTEDFLRGVANKNKPVVIPARYVADRSPEGISMFATNYNVVGEYLTGKPLAPDEAATKLCRDRGTTVAAVKALHSRKIVACQHEGKTVFVAVSFVFSYAYYDYDHIAVFDLPDSASTDDGLKWIANRYVIFESQSIKDRTGLDYGSVDREALFVLLKASAQ
jgi:hypothetical protein